MKNITVTMDEQIIVLGKEYAKKQHISFSALLSQLVEQRVLSSPKDWLDETFELMDKANVSSNGRTWTRDELYRG